MSAVVYKSLEADCSGPLADLKALHGKCTFFACRALKCGQKKETDSKKDTVKNAQHCRQEEGRKLIT